MSDEEALELLRRSIGWVEDELRNCRHDGKSAAATLLSIQIIVSDIPPEAVKL